MSRQAVRARHLGEGSIKEAIRAAGLRATDARTAVLSCVRSASGPLSHAEVFESVADEGFDQATVYRNLIDLAEAGLLRRSDLGDHIWRFERVEASGEGARHDAEAGHPHFVCSSCGTVACLPGASVEVRMGGVAPRTLREGRLEVQLRGLCDACA